MLYLASTCIGYQITSISSLASIGQISGILIDPHRFSVAGFWVEEYGRRQMLILLSQSMRQMHNRRVFVNSEDDFNLPKDLPRLREILTIDYQLPGKRVVSTDKEYLGRAEDFSFSDEDFKIIHLIVKPPLSQRLRTSRRQFSRSQIEKIRSKTIEVRVGPQTQLGSLPARP